MYKQAGIERALGTGGGNTVSRRSEKNLEKAEELFRRRKTKKALPYLLAAIEDGNNIDALMAAAFLLGKDAYLAALEAVADKGKQLLKDRFGEKCFETGSPQVGRFWAILETRPYMRVLQALVKAYVDENQYIQSTDTMLEMLRLCPGDNTSQRTWLGSNLIRIGRHADALYFSQQRLREWGIAPLGGGIDFKPPQEEVVPPEKEEKLSWLGNGSLLYTAALASFRMWGNCPKSCQYLRIAARANPNVLIKILACVSKPVKLNYDARVINGPEEAHDYLWLTQDLWMVSNVWSWANSVKEARDAILKTCSFRGCEIKEVIVAEFKRCSACHLVAYCEAKCQKKDWPHHKIVCHTHKEEKAAMRAFQMGKPPPAGNKTNVFGADFAEGGLGCITNARLL